MLTLDQTHTPLKAHPFANIFPMLSDAELQTLGEDIRDNGQAETVKLFNGLILDGRNRYAACTKLGLPVACEIFQGTSRQALNWVVSKNLKRRHLTESQRAIVGARLSTLKLGDNQHTAAPIGAPALDFGDSNQEVEAPISQSEAADMMSVGRRSVQRATIVEEKGTAELVQAVEQGKVAVSTAADIAEHLPAEEQRQIAQLSESEILAKAKEIRKEKNDKRRAERSERIRKIAENSADLPTGRRFPLVYFDPPTEFEAGDSDRSTENHYPTMDEEQIAALPIAELAMDDAVLAIWTTVPWLYKTLRMIEAWGFTYKSAHFWDKVNFGLGYWGRDQVEVLIFATRGNPSVPENGSVLGPNLYREKKTRHSAKPVYFRDLISKMPEWANWPKVELFARIKGELPENWFAWGNEAIVPDQQSLPITEDNCPGHVASDTNPKICGRCGVHIDSLRPDEEEAA